MLFKADVASSVLSDIVTAVINGSDGCVFCFGHAQLGKCSQPSLTPCQKIKIIYVVLLLPWSVCPPPHFST